MSIDLRPGRDNDLPQLLDIYHHYVRHSYATFDEVEVTLSDRQTWLRAYSASGPHRLFVAVDGDRVLGYATSSPYRQHPAFRHTVETSVYVAPTATGRGLGGRLYDALLASLAGTTADRVVAAVALPNDASVGLHLSRGFRTVGTFTDYAVKHGRRISSAWFERPVTS